MTVTRRDLLRVAGLGGVGAAGLTVATGSVAADPSRSADWGDQPAPEAYAEYTVHRVPEEYDTIQAAVDAADPRDLVLVAPGDYTESVEVETPRVTIRGQDRAEVVLDGGHSNYTAIEVTADEVVVENLTIRRWEYGIDFIGVKGYRASYVTAHDITEYGLYAFNSRYGRFDHCYASGCEDAGIYIGQAQPADAVVTDCVAEHNLMGFSGTNTGGNLVIKDSVWRQNHSGIVPNSMDSHDDPPQGATAGGIRIENNEIVGTGSLPDGAYTVTYPPTGHGIAIAGGHRNDVVDNRIRDQARYGILVAPNKEDNIWLPTDNTVVGNDVAGSGRADIAVGAPAIATQVRDNEYESARPASLGASHGFAVGDPQFMVRLFLDDFDTMSASYHRDTMGDLPAPDPQPGHPNPDGPPRRTIGDR